jgi:periplasmic protein TonB
VASVVSGRTAFIAFSLVAHGVFAVGIGELEVKKTHAATSIQIAETKKPAKKPEPTKVEPPPRKLEPPSKERRAPAKPAVEPLPEAAPPPDAPAPLADLPDFGLSLSGGVDGTGLAMPAGGTGKVGTHGPALPTTKTAPKKLAAVAAPSALDPCEDPPAKPKPRSVPQPAYTEAARAAAVEGKVRVQLTVDETGRVVSVKLLQGLGHGLDEAALAAAKQAEFEPAVRCGKATSATFNISMRFNLS